MAHAKAHAGARHTRQVAAAGVPSARAAPDGWMAAVRTAVATEWNPRAPVPRRPAWRWRAHSRSALPRRRPAARVPPRRPRAGLPRSLRRAARAGMASGTAASTHCGRSTRAAKPDPRTRRPARPYGGVHPARRIMPCRTPRAPTLEACMKPYLATFAVLALGITAVQAQDTRSTTYQTAQGELTVTSGQPAPRDF